MESVFVFVLFMPLALAALGLLVWSLVWAYNDAQKRGKPGWLVVLLVLFMNWPFSLLIWVLFRPDVQEPPKAA